MRRNIIVSVACLLMILQVGVTTASAQGKWVDSFLQRYRPTAVTFPPGPGVSQQELADMIRSGQLPLTVNDMINLLLSNNLDVGLNRLSPLSSEYLLTSLYRTFEPTVRLGASVGRSTTPSTIDFSS
jgi:hypothetical protein